MSTSPTHRFPVRPNLLAAAALVLCTAWGPSPAPGQSGDEPFGEVISVHVVNVDVRVTDRQGEPVHGLDVEDFTLREDGKRQDITNFREVLPATAADGAGEAGGAGASDAELPGLLIFLLDDVSLPAQARARAIRQVDALLDGGIDAETAVAVATVGDELRIYAQPSTDRAATRKALETITPAPPLGLTRQQERASYLREILRDVGETVQEVRAGVVDTEQGVRYLTALMRQVEGEAQRRRGETLGTYQGVATLLDALGTIDGRKGLVFLSGGLEIRPAQAEIDVIQEALSELSTRSREDDLNSNFTNNPDSLDSRSAALGALTDQAPRRPYRKRQEEPLPDELGTITALAAHARVSVYPWRIHGNLGVADATLGGEAGLGASPAVRNTAEAGLNEALRVLADETGGSAAIGSSLDDLVRRAEDDLGGYYSLGFSPTHGGDNQLHKLKVKVRGRGLQVWFPKTYYARAPDG
ncbi:MAG: VWA domain-containing protein [Acidobacteriota bacterium]